MCIRDRKGKMTCREIGEILGIPTSTVHHRIKKLIKNGAIKRFVPVVDYKKMDLNLFSIIGIKVKHGACESVSKKLADFEEVMCVFATNGIFDIVIGVTVKNMDALSDFTYKKMATIKEIESMEQMIVMKVYKSAAVL